MVMKFTLVLVLSLLFSACSTQPVESRRLVDQRGSEKSARTKKPVLVELFTSEGCSSCPPAEKVLAKLQLEQPFDKAEVITLALHVDYWDELGWKDKFASSLYTQRQRIYDRKFRTGRIYTPQMIVDGDAEFVGSNFKKAEKAISRAIKSDKADVKLNTVDSKIKIDITAIPKHEQATVYLAYAEDDLSSNIRSGENAGKNLTHVSVVRRLKAVSRLSEGESSFNAVVQLEIGSDWNRDNLNAVVFVQENKSRRVLAVKRMAIYNEKLAN